MAEHPIQGLMNVTMDKIRQMADSNTIIGKPIKTDDGTTILPVSRISFGFAAQAPTSTARTPPTRTCSAAAPARASNRITPAGGFSGGGRTAACAPSSCPTAPTPSARPDHAAPELVDKVSALLKKEEKKDAAAPAGAVTALLVVTAHAVSCPTPKEGAFGILQSSPLRQRPSPRELSSRSDD